MSLDKNITDSILDQIKKVEEDEVIAKVLIEWLNNID